MNTKFQVGEMVRSNSGSGHYYNKGDVGCVIKHTSDATVLVDWSVGNNPKGHYGDGEWWAKESELVRLAEPSAAKLTLPIVVGKKYVRRDGKTDVVAKIEGGLFFLPSGENGYTSTGKCSSFGQDCPADLVSDYIEPAKGLTIDQFGKIEEDGYGRLCFSFFRTSGHGGGNPTLPLLDACIERLQKAKQEELDRIANLPKPDPHAENAAEYAKDMAISNCAWTGWQAKGPNWSEWQDLAQHPSWYVDFLYRRKEAL